MWYTTATTRSGSSKPNRDHRWIPWQTAGTIMSTVMVKGALMCILLSLLLVWSVHLSHRTDKMLCAELRASNCGVPCIGLIMKAPVDELPVPCRSQGKHVPPGLLQFARLQELHRHQQPQCQPEATESGASIACQRMEQLLLHSRPPQHHRPPQAPQYEHRCSPQSKQIKRRGARRHQKQSTGTPTGRSWVSIGAIASQSPAGSWLSPEAALSALSNATDALNAASESAVPLASSKRALSSPQTRTSLSSAPTTSEPVATGARIDLRSSLPVQGTPPELEQHELIASSVVLRVVDAVIGETLDSVSRQTSDYHVDSQLPADSELSDDEYASSLYSVQGTQLDSCSASGVGEPTADLSLEDMLHPSAKCQVQADPGTQRIFPALDLCAEYSLQLAPRQQVWVMQVRCCFTCMALCLLTYFHRRSYNCMHMQ